jgi:hypothetical protein
VAQASADACVAASGVWHVQGIDQRDRWRSTTTRKTALFLITGVTLFVRQGLGSDELMARASNIEVVSANLHAG